MIEIKPKRRDLSKIASDERDLMKLLRDATGLKVFKGQLEPVFSNIYYSISQEYKCDKAHIQVVQGSWCIETGGEYKISIFSPPLIAGNRCILNVPFVQQVIDKIQEALNNEFSIGGWHACNNEQRVWIPLSRNSFYIQVPNF